MTSKHKELKISKKILLIDSDLDTLNHLHLELEKFFKDVIVYESTSLVSAIDVVEEFIFDLIIFESSQAMRCNLKQFCNLKNTLGSSFFWYGQHNEFFNDDWRYLQDISNLKKEDFLKELSHHKQ